ncbi:beta-lactamase family protein [Jannaschia sp. S6380]|uniref:serine hydrolase domain-containing protein n=1 Tax=Jannaschia sp. S6380 TaxID=2926408 RepID=UPI001FF3F2C0|nr:serine hydrolase [Jannaschia sp. S6380]MCK0167543.1 beta-lactamase family protein [Jannaschia sp. S6380]
MRRWIVRTGLALLALLGLAVGAAVWKHEEILRLMAVNTLFDADRIVANFSEMDRAFLTVPVVAEPGRALPEGPGVPLPAGAQKWIDERSVTGLVVLHDGQVTHESYHLGTGPDDLRMSWSVAKSFLSLLTGILIDEGFVALDDPVTRHAPELRGTAYDGATLEDVLQMESGVAFDEDYFDRASDINRMGRVIALGGALDTFTAGLGARDRVPGGPMKYVSMDTHVIGMVLRGATGRTIPDLMAEKVIGPLGIGPAFYLTDGVGAAFVLGGLNLTTRDYARMGLAVARGGRLDGRQVVPEAWVDQSTRPSANTEPGSMRYGYQWWMPADMRPGEVMAQGVYGQFVYIDRVRDVVIAVNSADRGFREPGVSAANIEMFRRIAAAQ